MEHGYLRAKKVILNALNEEFSDKVKIFAKKFDKFVNKVVEKGNSVDMDLSKILGLAQGLSLIKRKKNNKTKRLIIAFTIASLTVITLGLTIKSYSQIKQGKTVEDKIKIFIKSLELDKLSENPTVKKIRNEIKNLME